MDRRTHIRIARPTVNLEAAEAFWVAGVGLDVLWRHAPEPGSPYALLMVGYPDGGWHLELSRDPASPVLPTPTEEDLLVLYLGGEVDEDLLARITRYGGQLVPAANPYWDSWGVTLLDPDGYRLVLCTRRWA
ncbi:MAG TPA: VOC family protein [Mycobacteriales bacterium]|jgi:hypothetical protein|nr:VOC family protein [Mycobacteriales bacterium]